MRLGDVCTLVNGYAFKPTDWTTGGLPIIRIQNLNDENAPFNYYDGEIEDKYLVNNGDLLFAWSGTPGTSFGAFFWERGRGVLNQHIFNVYPNDILLKSYFRYVLNGNIDRIIEKAHGGVGLQHITKKELIEIDIPIPSKHEQQTIVKILDRVNTLIFLRKQQLAKLDELVKARFVELFGDPVVNTMGWNTDTVNNLCRDIYGGGTPSKAHPEYYENGDIPWVSSKDMKTDILYDSQIKINQLGVDNSTAKMVPVNSVIMVIRSGILKHTLPVAINAVPITVNQDLKVFIPNHKILPLFLLFLFKMLEKDILTGVRAVTADNIEFNSLKERFVIVPPIELQNQFAAFVEQTDKSKSAIQQSLDKLETLKKALMQKYFG